MDQAIQVGVGAGRCVTPSRANRSKPGSVTAPNVGVRPVQPFSTTPLGNPIGSTSSGAAKPMRGAVSARGGSTLSLLGDVQAEIAVGTLDEAPAALMPLREGWIKRREPWLESVQGAQQFREDTDI